MKYRNTKLITILSTFSAQEMTDFERYLASPFFRKGRDPIQLFRVLKKFHPGFKDGEFSEEAVLRELYPDIGSIDRNSMNTLRSLSSYLLKAVEDFLYISGIKDNKVAKNRVLLKQLLDRNLLKQYKSYMEQAYEDMKEDEDLAGLENLERYHLERLNSRYFSTQLEMMEYFERINRSIENISTRFWIDVLTSAKSIILGRDNYNFGEHKILSELLLEAVDMERVLKIHESAEDHFHILFHYYIYRYLVTKGDKQFFEKAKEVFSANKARLGKHDLVYFYNDLMNVFHIRFASGSLESKRELLNLIKDCLRDRAYKISEDDHMHPLFFRNAILCAEYLNDTDWGHRFIDEFGGELRPELRDNLCMYSRALMDYKSGAYESALVNISKVSYDLVTFKTDVKILMLRIFYELRLYEQALSTADTLRHFIRSTGELDQHFKSAFRNYVTFYLRLFKINISGSSDKVTEAKSLKKDIENEKLLTQRIWLTEKAEQLIGAKSGDSDPPRK